MNDEKKKSRCKGRTKAGKPSSLTTTQNSPESFQKECCMNDERKKNRCKGRT